MKRYDIVIKDNLKELIDTVNKALNHGYYPKGGIIHIDGNFIQTIYLRDDSQNV